MRKILCRFWKLEKHWEKFFSFGANGVWTCSGNLCQLWREYMRPAVNVLPNSRKISNLPKREMFSISICAGLMENYDQSGAVQILSMFPWARSLLKAVLKQELSCIQITTFSEVNTFQNIWTMNLKLFLKMRKILCTFQKWKKKNRESSFSFGDNGVWTSCGNLSQLWNEYIESAVKVLPNSSKI